jgi:uncharacterized protein (TIGR00369 family)
VTTRVRHSRTYEWETDKLDPLTLAGLSGLDFLRQMADGTIPGASIGATLDFRAATIEAGRVIFEGAPSDAFLNPLGGVHGGYVATLLDSALGCAVHSTLQAGVGYSTVELHINYVRGLTARSGPVLAEGKVVHVGKTIATAEGRLYGRDDGRLYAHATTTCVIFPLGKGI